MDDDDDIERLYFKTPLLTPHISDSNTADYFDLDCSFSSKEYQQRMSNFTNDLKKAVDRCLQSDGHESESDNQDQEPTEAIDNSEESSNAPTPKTNYPIDKSLHSHASKEQDDESLTVVAETNAVEDNVSNVMSDNETIPIEKSLKKPVLTYSRSLCVPYTNNDHEKVSFVEETLTTISTEPLKFTGVEKSDKNDIGHILISCNHSTKSICLKIAKKLKELNYDVWIHPDNITGDVFTSMASSIENCFVVLMAINELYSYSRYCRLEAEYSVECNKVSIPMLMQAGYKPTGWLGIINGSKLQVDFATLSFDEAFSLLVREIDAVRVSLGAGETRSSTSMSNSNQLTTTTNNSWFHSRSIHEWSAEDVIDWLHRTKLDIFEGALRNFNGKTLWQLHEVKLNSPTDFYRMIESLIPPTIPNRLFHSLTFDAALESLFSSSMRTTH